MSPKHNLSSDSDSDSDELVYKKAFLDSDCLTSETESDQIDAVTPHSRETLHIATNRSRGTRGKCLNKNAVMARQNRIRKKMYVESLEEEVKNIRLENNRLSLKHKQDKKLIQRLIKDIQYLRHVLREKTPICKILTGLNENLKKPNNSRGELTTYNNPLIGANSLAVDDQLFNMGSISTDVEGNSAADNLETTVESTDQSLQESFGRLAVHLPYGDQDEPER